MWRRTEDGAAAVEFAILLPVFVLLVLGMIEFGLLIWRQEILTNASREGARAGIVSGNPRPTSDDIIAVVSIYLSSAGIDPSILNISVNGAEGLSGESLTVLVQYPYPFLILPNLMAGLGTSLTLQAQTMMSLE